MGVGRIAAWRLEDHHLGRRVERSASSCNASLRSLRSEFGSRGSALRAKVRSQLFTSTVVVKSNSSRGDPAPHRAGLVAIVDPERTGEVGVRVQVGRSRESGLVGFRHRDAVPMRPAPIAGSVALRPIRSNEPW